MFLNFVFLFLYIWGYTVVALPNRKRKKLTQERTKKKSRDNRLKNCNVLFLDAWIISI